MTSTKVKVGNLDIYNTEEYNLIDFGLSGVK